MNFREDTQAQSSHTRKVKIGLFGASGSGKMCFLAAMNRCLLGNTQRSLLWATPKDIGHLRTLCCNWNDLCSTGCCISHDPWGFEFQPTEFGEEIEFSFSCGGSAICDFILHVCRGGIMERGKGARNGDEIRKKNICEGQRHIAKNADCNIFLIPALAILFGDYHYSNFKDNLHYALGSLKRKGSGIFDCDQFEMENEDRCLVLMITKFDQLDVVQRNDAFKEILFRLKSDFTELFEVGSKWHVMITGVSIGEKTNDRVMVPLNVDLPILYAIKNLIKQEPFDQDPSDIDWHKIISDKLERATFTSIYEQGFESVSFGEWEDQHGR